MRPHVIISNMWPQLITRGSMYKKFRSWKCMQWCNLLRLNPWAWVEHLADQLLLVTAQLLVTRVSPAYLVDEFTFLFLVLLNEMRMLGKSSVLPFLFLFLIKRTGRWGVSRSSHRRCSSKKLFLKTSQYLQENTSFWVSF